MDREFSEKVDVLIVDDRPEGLITLQAVLDSPRYNLVTAMSGQEALASLMEHDFAAILMDVQMPYLDGFETVSLMKQSDESMDIPVIFVTAISKEDGFMYRGYEVGAVDYISKPFDPDILRAKVSIFVDLHLKNKKIKEQAESIIRLERVAFEREKTTREIASLIKYRRLSDVMPIIVCNADSKGQMIFFNSAWGSFSGLDESASLGNGWQTAFHKVDLDICLEKWRTASFLKSHFKVECRILQKKDQTYRWHLIRGVPEIDNKSGRLEGWVGTATDIHDQKLAFEERNKLLDRERKMVAALERSNRDLEQFAYVASHDLTEPLRSVSAYSQLVAKKYSQQLDDTGREYIQYITEGALRMKALLTDILSYSRLNVEDEDLAVIDTAKVISSVLVDLKRAIAEAGATFEVGKLPAVLGNKTQLSQLFLNLIGNALKFRNKDHCKITVSASAGDGEWVFSVNDNGIGIQSQYSHQIFDIFKRLHSRADYVGNGIGLAICKKILEQHSGKIWVTSEAGQGSTFFFTLRPTPETNLDQAKADQPNSEGPILERLPWSDPSAPLDF